MPSSICYLLSAIRSASDIKQSAWVFVDCELLLEDDDFHRYDPPPLIKGAPGSRTLPQGCGLVMFKRSGPSRLREIDARRVCIIKPSALGDIVQTLPLLPVLRERYRNAEITWVVRRELSGLLEGHPDLAGIVPFDRRGGWAGWRRLLSILRRSRFDLVFDLQGLLRTGVMTAATGAPFRVGLENAREGAHLATNIRIRDTGRLVPAHQRYWRVAEALGLGELRRETTIVIPEVDRLQARQMLAGLTRPLLAIHPGAAWVTKRWPVEKFAAAAAKATRRFGFSTVVLGGPDERPLAAQLEYLIRKLHPRAQTANVAGRTTIKQLAAVVDAADVVLSNDSGPMHLAAGLGTPTVGVFTCTSPLRSGPPGDAHELAATSVACAGSYCKRCPHSGRRHMACLEELATERVWQALIRVVEKVRKTRTAA